MSADGGSPTPSFATRPSRWPQRSPRSASAPATSSHGSCPAGSTPWSWRRRWVASTPCRTRSSPSIASARSRFVPARPARSSSSCRACGGGSTMPRWPPQWPRRMITSMCSSRRATACPRVTRPRWHRGLRPRQRSRTRRCGGSSTRLAPRVTRRVRAMSTRRSPPSAWPWVNALTHATAIARVSRSPSPMSAARCGCSPRCSTA